MYFYYFPYLTLCALPPSTVRSLDADSLDADSLDADSLDADSLDGHDHLIIVSFLGSRSGLSSPPASPSSPPVFVWL